MRIVFPAYWCLPGPLPDGSGVSTIGVLPRRCRVEAIWRKLAPPGGAGSFLQGCGLHGTCTIPPPIRRSLRDRVLVGLAWQSRGPCGKERNLTEAGSDKPGPPG